MTDLSTLPNLSEETLASADQLMDLGWLIHNVYSDGVVLMAKPDSDVRCFIGTQGRVRHPHTAQTMIAESEMKEAGIELYVPTGTHEERLA